MIDYIITRSNRKTVAIHIREDATVEVRSPLKLPKTEINRIVESKMDWIESHLLLKKKSIESKNNFSLNYGDLIRLRGKSYPIVGRAENYIGFDGECFYLPLNLNNEDVIYNIVNIYKNVAKKIISSRVSHYSDTMGLSPASVKINSAKKRWGSCSNRGNLNFSWKLIMAENDVIDYVVIHELAHIKELNHSDKFWNIVEAYYPEYKKCLIKLKELQKKLAHENWDLL